VSDREAYPPALRALLRRAGDRLRQRLEKRAPALAAHTEEWLRWLGGDSDAGPADRYFTHPRAFPMLLLPWWLEGTIRGSPSRSFQADVVYSTMCGYYFIRLIDDLMDGEGPPDRAVLPALIVLHTEFEQAYHPHFPSDHPFWGALTAASYDAAETAARDAALEHIERDDFLRTSARKVAGARVPLAAVCHRSGRLDLYEPWSDFVDLFGRWHQMLNDLLGWSADLGRGRTTYFLSEAQRHSPGSPGEWVLGDGLAWGIQQLDGWMDELLAAAPALGCPPLLAYLEARRLGLAREWQALETSLEPIRRIASTLG
jgi:hypothetical protein